MPPIPVTDGISTNINYGSIPYAVITGFGGQDSNHLAKLLLQKGYRVLGLVKPSPFRIEKSIRLAEVEQLSRIYNGNLVLDWCDICDQEQVKEVLSRHEPFWMDEVYHLAAETTVREPYVDFETLRRSSVYITNCLGTKNVLDAVVELCDPAVRVLLAGTSQMYGNSATKFEVLNEDTPMDPTTAYGVSKLMMYGLSIDYSSRGINPIRVATAILFYHKSHLSQGFLWDQVINGLMQRKWVWPSKKPPIAIGNLDAQTDFGWPDDYADAMHRIIQQRAGQPSDMRDYVVATGLHQVREFVEIAARVVWGDNPKLHWEGCGASERLLWGDYPLVVVDPAANARPYQELTYCGDSSKLRNELGWQPTHTLQEMVEESVQAMTGKTATAP